MELRIIINDNEYTHGEYRGIQWCIGHITRMGHWVAYIAVPKVPGIENRIEVPYGVTYHETHFPTDAYVSDRNVIGWDYAHPGVDPDYSEVLRDVIDAIDGHADILGVQ